MKTNRVKTVGIALVSVLMLWGTTCAFAQYSELINLLMNNLGVSQQQAEGGAGALFNLAKDKLSADDFSKITSVVPEMDSLLDAAPQLSGLGKALGDKASLMGGSSDTLGGFASLQDSFSKLGLESDMVGKFADTILSYVNSKGGASTANILAGVLK
jgi:hypothetical protein